MIREVRPISSETHREYLDRLASSDEVSFLQTPAWQAVKPDWKGESVGFFVGSEMVGVGLILYRQIPKVKRYLAYLPEGPVLDWTRDDVGDLLDALVRHAKGRGAFGVRIGPTAIHRRWNAQTIKDAIANPSITKLSDATPDDTDAAITRLIHLLESRGWHPTAQDAVHFSAGQPQFNFQLPLQAKTPDDLLKGMNQLWRRNIKKADKAGVTVRVGDRDDLATFHRVYLETAERDGFTPRPLEYFTTMWDALNEEDPNRMRVYLAELDGTCIAATTMVTVNAHAWYSYGASTTEHRDARGSNAVQWQMIQDALAQGASVYDMRGITEGLASDDPELGLIQFKVGTGGEAIAFIGEWDKPINRLLYRAFDVYMKRRAR